MRLRIQFGEAAVTFLILTSSALSAPPTIEQIFSEYRPRQRDVEYDTPSRDQFAKCKIDLEKRGNHEGWVVLGPEGQVLRRFVDAGGTGKVNEWRYFQQGIEVYREIDTNKNNKPDQFRWLNLGGSRWGIDANEDGKIDSWKTLSAAEASREAIRAVTSGDDDALQMLMITAEDIRVLGIDKQVGAKLLASAQEAPKKLRVTLQKSKVLNAQSKWMKFDAQMPGVIPADDGKATTDLHVYENAMVIVENGKQSGLVQIAEMVRVGDVWKLTQAPLPIDVGIKGEPGEGVVISSGILIQPALVDNVTTAGPAYSAEMQKLVDELQALDAKPPAPTAGRDAMAKYYSNRNDLVLKIYRAADSDEEKQSFMKQLIDGVFASIQTGVDPDGVTRLKSIETDLRKSSAKSPLISYIAYRRLSAEYTVDLSKAETDERANVQKKWLEALEEFITSHPQAEDVPDAMLQLAMNDEFMGKAKEASGWYQRIVKEQAKSPAAAKAQGALTRLSLTGKPVTIAGPGLNGKTISTEAYRGQAAVLVMYWATWCEPCIAELPELRALHQQYRGEFEIIGISLDMNKEPIGPFLQKQKLPWPQIYQEGGLESPLAVQFGVFSPPVMILIDKTGKVVSKNTSSAELKKILPQVLKGK